MEANVLQAVIFDMDGVLVDSEPMIRAAAVKLFDEIGQTVSERDFMDFTGMGENRFIGGVAERYGVSLDIEEAKRRLYEIYGEIIQGNLPPLDGAIDFMKKARDRGLKLAVATSADMTKVRQNLGEIGIPPEHFDACVTGNDIEHKKPAPDIFLAAAAKLGIPAQNCLVVEDAVSGVQAAKSAGCRCLALTTTFPRYELAQADWISNTLADAPAETLAW